MFQRRLHQFVWSVVLVVALWPAVGWADIVNGDFEAALDLDGWSTYLSDPSCQVDVLNGYSGDASRLAHLAAQSQYVYQSGQWVGDNEYANLWQDNIITQPGQSAIRFDGLALMNGTGLLAPKVSYNAVDLINMIGGTGYADVTGESWGSYEMPLLDIMGNPMPAGTIVTITVEINANAPAAPGQEGQTLAQLNQVFVDNFQLVPEPATLLALLGGLGLVKRGRRS